jgi:hypothetical protein
MAHVDAKAYRRSPSASVTCLVRSSSLFDEVIDGVTDAEVNDALLRVLADP